MPFARPDVQTAESCSEMALKADRSAVRGREKAANKRQAGFSLIELVFVVLIILVLVGIALPSVANMAKTYRLTGDARSIAAELNLVRIRAASLGTRTRLNVNLVANTYQVEYWNKTALIPAWVLEGGVMNLSQGNSFGFGTLGTPAGNQTPIAQGYPTETGCGCVYFNSRGIVTDANGAVMANSALYITNGKQYSAVALSIAGQTTSYIWSGAGWNRM